MSDTPISLASLMTPSKTVTIDFPGYAGMSVDLCYLAREELIKLRKKCVTTKFNKKTRQPEEELDDDKFLLELDFFDKKRDGFLGSSGHSERAEMQRMADVINELSKKVQQLEKEVTSMKIDMI